MRCRLVADAVEKGFCGGLQSNIDSRSSVNAQSRFKNPLRRVANHQINPQTTNDLHRFGPSPIRSPGTNPDRRRAGYSFSDAPSMVTSRICGNEVPRLKAVLRMYNDPIFGD